MSPAQMTTEPGAEGRWGNEPRSPPRPESPDALIHLAALVNAQEASTLLGHRVGLRLHGNRPNPFPRDRFELMAHSHEGWEVATVTVGERAGYFLVSLPTVGAGCQQVNGDQPYTVVAMILAALPKVDATTTVFPVLSALRGHSTGGNFTR
ncbi:hypothetical protein [Streptomyces anulatus]|uniref:hypothetical protein n=1 Tax=Streptomyces anulatus TaxID=1892 RepID=UPI003439CAFA